MARWINLRVGIGIVLLAGVCLYSEATTDSDMKAWREELLSARTQTEWNRAQADVLRKYREREIRSTIGKGCQNIRIPGTTEEITVLTVMKSGQAYVCKEGRLQIYDKR